MSFLEGVQYNLTGGREGENVSLKENAILFTRFIRACTKRFVFVSLALPSVWYESTPAGIKIQEYFKAQKDRKCEISSIEMERILIADFQGFQSDPPKDDYKKDHEEDPTFMLQFCERSSLADPAYEKDLALFEDKKGKWVIA